jgi:hypothetical protein
VNCVYSVCTDAPVVIAGILSGLTAASFPTAAPAPEAAAAAVAGGRRKGKTAPVEVAVATVAAVLEPSAARSQAHLAQVAFLSGHVAIKELVRIEEEERVLQRALAAKAGAAPTEQKKSARSDIRPATKFLSPGFGFDRMYPSLNLLLPIEEELGIAAAAQEQTLEDMAARKEAIIVSTLLGQFPPLVSAACRSIASYQVRFPFSICGDTGG